MRPTTPNETQGLAATIGQLAGVGQFDAAGVVIKGNIGRYPELPKELSAQLGALIKGKQFERAIRLVDLCLQHDEGNVFFLGRKVQALLGLNRHEEALQVAEVQVKLQPANVIGLGLKTQALLGLNRHEEALQVAEVRVKLQPANVIGLGLKTQALLGLNRHEEALQVAEAQVKLQPANVIGLGLKTQALLGLNRHEEALQVAEARVKLQPADVIGLGLKTQALLGLKRHEEALEVAEAIVKLEPTAIVGQILRAQILFRGGQTGAAAEVVYGNLIKDGRANFSLAVLAAKLAARGIYEERYDAVFSSPDSFFPLTPSQAGSLIKHRIAREEDPSVTDPFGDTIFDASRTYLFQPIDKLARSIL
jgi:predicted Zn-dependent protease